MDIIERVQFKDHPEISLLVDKMKANYTPPEHTVWVLMENRHIEGFTERSRHFVQYGGVYLHFDIECSLSPSKASLRMVIKRIAIYDSFGEYTTERTKALGGLN